jgi:hypothetical protein
VNRTVIAGASLRITDPKDIEVWNRGREATRKKKASERQKGKRASKTKVKSKRKRGDDETMGEMKDGKGHVEELDYVASTTKGSKIQCNATTNELATLCYAMVEDRGQGALRQLVAGFPSPRRQGNTCPPMGCFCRDLQQPRPTRIIPRGLTLDSASGSPPARSQAHTTRIHASPPPVPTRRSMVELQTCPTQFQSRNPNADPTIQKWGPTGPRLGAKNRPSQIRAVHTAPTRRPRRPHASTSTPLEALSTASSCPFDYIRAVLSIAKRRSTTRLRINKVKNQYMLIDHWPTLRPPSPPVSSQRKVSLSPFPGSLHAFGWKPDPNYKIRHDPQRGQNTHSGTHPPDPH